MDKTFDLYSKYYDLLYKDKDYEAEAKYVKTLLGENGTNIRDILELGCGTGRHAHLLNRAGYNVFGIDSSSSMLEQAKLIGVNCVKGDVRTFRADKTFDAVVSLFHVADYQTSNDDLTDFFRTASVHLKSGGIFIFDCWYGPCVLNIKPEIRIKKLENENISIRRTAIPTMHPNENIADVNYEIDIISDGNRYSSLKETHRMRYLFRPEIELILKMTGFNLLKSEEWLSRKEPGSETWSVVFICEKT
ncbi:MAG: methyltransferase domain-containing protein [Holosporaceae bacterium]|jgi:SAM-dependent methyltransferase|nr:methyltransferase domain-containing protein [Holosporaceae bacterium]